DAGALAAENLQKLKDAALERFGGIRKLYAKMVQTLQKNGVDSKKYQELQAEISSELMAIRFAARQVERLCDSVRSEVENIRHVERKVQDICVNKAGMPRPHFIKVFPENEMNPAWIDSEIGGRKPYSENLVKYRPSILEHQQKLLALQSKVMVP